MIAAAVRGGESSHGWQLVARGADKLDALKGKRVLVPGIGGRETELVLNVLLGGEVAKDFFAKIETAPDTVSALAALGLGKADAVVVPMRRRAARRCAARPRAARALRPGARRLRLGVAPPIARRSRRLRSRSKVTSR